MRGENIQERFDDGLLPGLCEWRPRIRLRWQEREEIADVTGRNEVELRITAVQIGRFSGLSGR